MLVQYHAPYLGCIYFSKSDFLEITFQTFICLFVIKKIGQQKIFSSQRKIWLGFYESVFLWFWVENNFWKLWKIYKCHIICWLYQIWSSNFFLLYIYILFWIFVFQFHPLEFNFYINFGSHFYNYYLLFPYHFLIEIFYLLNLVLILLIVTYFIWNNLWNVNYYYFNFFIFQFFFIF